MIGWEEGPFRALSPRREPGCPATLELEEFAFAEPHERESMAVHGHLSRCARCQAEVEQLERERVRFLLALPPATFMAQVRTRAERAPAPLARARPSPRKLGWLGAALAAAAVALLTMLPAEPAAENPAMVSLRGTQALELAVFVSRAGGPALPLAPDEQLVQGDVLRFAARTPRRGHVHVVNVDDRGRVTLYLPQMPGADLSVEASERLTPLPGSIRLDGFVGRELVALVVSDAPLAAQAVVQAFTRAYAESGGQLERFAAPELPAQMHWRILRKRAP